MGGISDAILDQEKVNHLLHLGLNPPLNEKMFFFMKASLKRVKLKLIKLQQISGSRELCEFEKFKLYFVRIWEQDNLQVTESEVETSTINLFISGYHHKIRSGL